MNLRLLLPVALLTCLLPPMLGCKRKHDEERQHTISGPVQLDPVRPRTTSLIDRADQADPTPEPGGNDPFMSLSGEGRFAIGSGGIDDLQIGVFGPARLDLRPLEPETRDLAYKDVFERGEALLERGQFDQALVLFDQAKTLDPKNYRAYVGEAFSYYRKGDYGRAAAAIDFAILNAPDLVVLHNHRAHIRAQLGEFSKAIEELSIVLKAQPDDIASLISRAQFHLQMNNYPAALADFSAALKIKPNEPMLLLNRSIAYFRIGKFKECEADATAVINQRRDVIDAFFVRAVARAQLNDLIGGRTDYDEAVKLGLAAKTATMWRPRFYPDEQPTGAGAGS